MVTREGERVTEAPKKDWHKHRQFQRLKVKQPIQEAKKTHTRLVSILIAAIWNYPQASFHAKPCMRNPTTEETLLPNFNGHALARCTFEISIADGSESLSVFSRQALLSRSCLRAIVCETEIRAGTAWVIGLSLDSVLDVRWRWRPADATR
ncbi:hypothetical protein DL98DRAFT_61694 [Cadophora sp. DSE1049]|nr:hypothetical protein DL98DRAFT_61694 [Cadophora sp. DSE1049]